MEAGYLSNFSYIFIPFSLKNSDQFYDFNQALVCEGIWTPVQDEIKYLHRYVSDRLIGHEKETNFRHYTLSSAANAALHLNDRYYRTAPKRFKGENNVTFDFLISDVQLYLFSTSIAVMSFQLQFKNNDPYWIAGAQYYLRKIETELIRVTEDNGEETSQSFVSLSKQLLGKAETEYEPDFFFYTTRKNERANFLTYLDLPKKKDYREELFFLKWCYHDGFVYEDDTAEEDNVLYQANANVTWGISPSAAVCLVNRDDTNRAFIEGTFQKNFKNQYLFTYLLLLHQKYMMYLLLTKTSVGIDNDLELMEEYKRRLFDFETGYMFSKISEVPQYQRFYEKVERVFGLKEMFLDVQEPLSRLAEIQRQEDEERRQRYDNGINTALATLSLLTIVSALTDASGITSDLEWLLSPTASRIIQITSILLVIATCVVMTIRLFSLRKKR